MTNTQSRTLSPFVPKALVLIWLALGFLLWLRDRPIRGPFVFGDEALYFNLGRTIFTEGNYAGHTSYNPLYPLVIAPFFALPSAIHTYEGIRILNCVLWSSVVFPVYLLSRRFLKDQRVSYLLALATALTPLSAVVSIIWAEPLFYPLYAFCVLLFVKLLETHSQRWAAVLGVACALLFLTKQAGIALAFSILLGLLLHYYRSVRAGTRFFRCIVLYAGTLALTSAPWLIRNRITPGAGLIGYAHWTELMTETVLTPRMLGAIGYNISYIVTALCSVYLIYYICGLTLQSKDPVYATFAAFTVILSLAVLIIASSISTVVPEYAKNPIFFPAGRYLSLIFPFVFIVGAAGAQQADNPLRERLTMSVLLCGASCVILFLWTPLKAVGAKSCIDNPNLSVLTYLWEHRNSSFFWNLPRPVSIFEKTCVALAPCAALLLFLLLRKTWQPVAALLILMAGSSMVAARFVYQISLAQADNNRVAKMLVKNHIDDSAVLFDPALNPQVSPFPFWLRNVIFSHRLKTAAPSVFRFPAVFVFGTKDSPIAEGAIPVQAPWVGSSLYNEDQGYGFDPENVYHLLGHAAPDPKPPFDGLEGYVYGDQPSRFRIQTGSEHFGVTIWVAAAGNGAPIDFDCEVNGARRRVSREEAAKGLRFQLERVRPAGEFIDVMFYPRNGGNWAVSKLQVEPEQNLRATDGARYYVSTHKLPLPVALKSGRVFLYELPGRQGQSLNSSAASQP